MKVIKKVTMFVAVDENDIKEFDSEDMPSGGDEYKEWLKDRADNMLELDLDGMLCENPRQYNASWTVENPTDDDKRNYDYQNVVEQITEG